MSGETASICCLLIYFVAMFKSLDNEGDLEIHNHEFSSTIH